MGIRRPSITSKTRVAILLAAGQAACLAVGLWVHSRLIVATPENPPSSAAVGTVSFVWIAGLQGLAVWLVLTHLQGEERANLTESQQQSLILAL